MPICKLRSSHSQLDKVGASHDARQDLVLAVLPDNRQHGVQAAPSSNGQPRCARKEAECFPAHVGVKARDNLEEADNRGARERVPMVGLEMLADGPEGPVLVFIAKELDELLGCECVQVAHGEDFVEAFLELARHRLDSTNEGPLDDEFEILCQVVNCHLDLATACLELNVVAWQREVEREIVHRSVRDADLGNGRCFLLGRAVGILFDSLLGSKVLLEVLERLGQSRVDGLREENRSALDVTIAAISRRTLMLAVVSGTC